MKVIGGIVLLVLVCFIQVIAMIVFVAPLHTDMPPSFFRMAIHSVGFYVTSLCGFGQYQIYKRMKN